jgi:hypothetical protein
VPELAGADSFSWIPAGTIHRVDSRRAAPEQFDAEVYLVPAAEPRQGGACDGRLEAVLTVCLVAVGDETFVRCFPEDEVEGGRAVAVTPAGVAYGVVPDRVERVTLGAAGENVSANVHDNAFEMPIAAKVGDELRMPRWAPRIETGDRLEVAKPCATARELRQHGSSLIFSFGDGRGVAGVAPPGTRGVQVLDGDRVHDLAITGGVFGGLLPAAFRPPDDPAVEPARVRYMR